LFPFLSRSAMFVCLSVTRRYWLKTYDRIRSRSLHAALRSPATPVFWDQLSHPMSQGQGTSLITTSYDTRSHRSTASDLVVTINLTLAHCGPIGYVHITMWSDVEIRPTGTKWRRCTAGHFFHVPSLGEVGPVSHYLVAERSLFVAVFVSAVSTMRNSEHVIDLVPVKGITSPLRPRTAWSAMVECVYVDVCFLLQQHMVLLFKVWRMQGKFTHEPIRSILSLKYHTL